MSEAKTYLADCIGRSQILKVSTINEHGAYLVLKNGVEGDEVLLPGGYLTDEIKKGSAIKVFVYKDSEDRLVATTEKPLITLGQVARLEVKEVTGIGAFLDMGLKKDLLLPFREQVKRVRPGEHPPVAMYLDKSERLCATMKLYDYLSSDSPYKKNDHVRGYIYEITESFGAFVVVDDKYSALIPHNEMNRVLNVGDEIDARVKDVRDDGKLTLSLQEKAKKQMKEDADIIFDRLESSGGFLPFHDKTNPEIIKREFGISKAAFKRAIGRLKKQNRIDIGEDGIRKI